MDAEKLIGRKVRGFKFKGNDILGYDIEMNNFIGITGTIKKILKSENYFLVEFKKNVGFEYPSDQIEAHLVENGIPTLSDGVIMLVSDNGVDWQLESVFGQRKGIYLVLNNTIDTTCSTWNYAKPLKATKEEELIAILGSSEKVSEIMELFKN